MNRRDFVTLIAGAAAFSKTEWIAAQGRTLQPDLMGATEKHALTPTNRSASPLIEGGRRGARVSAAEGEGVAFLAGTEFSTGTIEIDLRGKDVPQRSFLGVAFHAGGNVYDCVYFRPFNFRAVDAVSRSHAVQYHSLPNNGWQKLRTEHPGQYEHAVNPVPDPNGWFHARLVVDSDKVSVFVNDATTPCLSVTLLGERKSGLVGLWVGNNSGGDFADLKISSNA